MNFNLRDRTVFLTLAGSRSFGFHEETSDWDYRGIAIPPTSTYIGLGGKFEQAVDDEKQKWIHPLFSDVVPNFGEFQIYEITKFMRLAMENNPSILEILFSEKDSIFINHPVLKPIFDNKEKLLSKQARARYSGYAHAMIVKMARHKRWLDNPVTHQPTREEYNLPPYEVLSRDFIGAAQAMIDYEVNDFMIDQTHLPADIKIDLHSEMIRVINKLWMVFNSTTCPYNEFEQVKDHLEDVIAQDLKFSENFLEILRRERKYRAALKDWKSYQKWLAERNPARAALEAKAGYDCKNATHCVRLLKMGEEILEKGTIYVNRPDAEELRAIRNGAWTYQEVLDYAEKMNKKLEELYKKSSLPKVPDFHFFNDLVFNCVTEYNKVNK